MYSYYVPELAGRTYTLSFNFTYTPGTTTTGVQEICIIYDDSTTCNTSITSLLSDDSQRISVKIPARNSKYLRIKINEDVNPTNKTTLTMREVN